MSRFPLALAAALATLALVGCGGSSSSSSDADHSVESVSRGVLSEASCEEDGSDEANGERSFGCTALYRGRRIKVNAGTGEAGRGFEAMAWRCGPPDQHWKRITMAQRRRCQLRFQTTEKGPESGPPVSEGRTTSD